MLLCSEMVLCVSICGESPITMGHMKCTLRMMLPRNELPVPRISAGGGQRHVEIRHAETL